MDQSTANMNPPTKWLCVTTEENWEQCLKNGVWGASDNRSTGLKQIKVGDELLVYIKTMKLVGIFKVNREYFYDSKKIWKDGIFPHRIGFEPTDKVLSHPVDIRSLYNEQIKPKKGSAGGYFGMGIRKIPEQEYSLFKSIIEENLSKGPRVFVTGYNHLNLKHSIEWSVLGWRNRPHNLRNGDYVFVYDNDEHRVNVGFRVLGQSENDRPVWEEEIKSDQQKQQFPYRWNADVICDKINIDLNKINEFDPFKNQVSRKFIPLVRNNFPSSIDEDKYTEFRKFLLDRCKMNQSTANGNDSEKSRAGNPSEQNLWLVRAGNEGQGEQIALERNLVGIGYDGLPGLDSIKDYKKFKEHYADTHKSDKPGRINNVVPQIWKFMNVIKNDDLVILPLKTQKSNLIAVGQITGNYQFRDLNSEIKQFRPVVWLRKDVPRGEFDSEIAEAFGYNGTVYHIGGPDAVKKVKGMLDGKEPERTVEIESNKRNWLSLTDEEIQDIVDQVLNFEGRRLEIDPAKVKRIISHLMLSKHVILVGAPGTGKTDLAIRLLRELGKRVIGKMEPVEAVASYEWGRYEVIGGTSIASGSAEDSFHLGCVTDAILQEKLLLIDEFNRADMNKAFGEMFLAIDHGTILLREDERPKGFTFGSKNEIKIPPEFRMICTMNDYDKSLLNELSYGLLRRFAFVEIGIPHDKEKIKNIIIERVKLNLAEFSDPVLESGLIEIKTQIDKVIEFIFGIKEKRQIGLSSYIDVVRYILFQTLITKMNPWKAMNDALIDYVVPQFDRLDFDTLDIAYKYATSMFMTEDKKPISELQPFLDTMNEKLRKLQDLNKLFSVSEKT